MPRARRNDQVEVDPGRSEVVEGLRDEGGNAVIVTVAVRTCEDPGGGVDVEKSHGRWSVELPPDTMHDLGGLVGEDGVAVRLTIISRPCPGSDKDGRGVPQPLDDGPDIAAPHPLDDDPDIVAEAFDDDDFGQIAAADIDAARPE